MENEVEPHDNYLYNRLSFNGDTIHFYLKSIRFYEELLTEDIEAMENDKDLAFLLGKLEISDLEIQKELKSVTKARELIERIIESGSDAWGYEMNLFHRDVRFLKSVALLYIQHLRNRRNILAARPRLSKHALMAVDQKISYYEEKTNLGVFNGATVRPLLVSELTTETQTSDTQTKRPQSILIDSIEILDPELKLRCLDLFHSFQQDGQHERLDTVVTEATRILEDKLRAASGAPSDCIGIDLATFAFGPKAPRLIVSNLPAEQEAVHLLFRGAFGFIRNHVHHQLVRNLLPERVLQIVGMIDYLIFLVQDAKRLSTETENGG